MLCFSLVSGLCSVCLGLFALPLGAIGRLWFLISALLGQLLHAALTLSMLGEILADDILKDVSYLFFRKQDLTFHANCLQWRQFA